MFPKNKAILIYPNLAETIEHQQEQQKKAHNSLKAKLRGNDGIIENKLRSLTYQVNVEGKTKKVHVDHLLPFYP